MFPSSVDRRAIILHLRNTVNASIVFNQVWDAVVINQSQGIESDVEPMGEVLSG